MSEIELPASAPAHIGDCLPRVLAASDFVREALARDPALLPDLIASGELEPRPSETTVPRAAAHAPTWPAGSPPPESDFMTRLRRWRTREMVRIAWRDLAGWAPLEETLTDLTAFADAAIASASRYGEQLLAARYGVPRSPAGEQRRSQWRYRRASVGGRRLPGTTAHPSRRLSRGTRD